MPTVFTLKSCREAIGSRDERQIEQSVVPRCPWNFYKLVWSEFHGETIRMRIVHSTWIFILIAQMAVIAIVFANGRIHSAD